VKRSYPLLLGVSGAIVGLDQWSKQQATAHLALREPVRVLGELVRLTYARNSGIAFSLFAGRGFPLWIFSLVAAVAVVVLFARHARLSPGRQLALAFILGGAVGNLIDRVTTGLVVDFILLSWGRHEFPVFNVADVAVTCGVTLFALTWTQDDEPGEAAGAPPAAPGSAHDETGSHEQDGGPDRSGAGSGSAGGPLAGQGTDRPVA
jgi:signal peptidase II